MEKDLKTSYILFIAFAGIVAAFLTLTNFFRGVAINFVALCAIFIAIIIKTKDKETFSKVKDLFFITAAFLCFEFILFMFLEFGQTSFKIMKVFGIMQMVVSGLGVLFLIYAGLRFVFCYRGISFGVVNKSQSVDHPKKEKKAKELSNGSLEDKPNNIIFENSVEDSEEE